MKSIFTASELRTALAAVERKGAGRPYPEPLRRAAVAHYRHRQQQGASLQEVEAELGVSGMSLLRWSRRSAALTPGFREVEVIEAQPEVSAPASGIIVHGPRGVRIEGMHVADVAELLRRLI
jgi:hypothetical protein